jgi:hypothetical protein
VVVGARGAQGKVQLRLRARLDHVATLAAPPTYVFRFRVRCTSCRETHDKWVDVTRAVRRPRHRERGRGREGETCWHAQALTGSGWQERVDVPGSRGTAHLVMKCKLCRRDLSLGLPPTCPPPPRAHCAAHPLTVAMGARVLGRACAEIMDDKTAAGTLTAEVAGFQPFALLDARGLELVAFQATVRACRLGTRGWRLGPTRAHT